MPGWTQLPSGAYNFGGWTGISSMNRCQLFVDRAGKYCPGGRGVLKFSDIGTRMAIECKLS